MSNSAQVSVATIDSFLNTVGAGMNKSAAAPLSEPGSIGGETSHPVKSVDDRLIKAKEGERSAENAKDLKEDQGAVSVDAGGSAKAASFSLLGSLAKRAGEIANPPGTADEDQLQIGTNKQPTGDDPANETNKAKAGKEDPGSSHPARTDNDSLDGHKYAYDANTSLEKMAADLKSVGEDLCASLEVYTGDAVKQASAQPQGQPQRQPVKQASARLTPELAQQAGWEVAGIVNKTMDKAAADRMVHAELTSIVKEAFDDASNVAEFMNARRRKQAEDEMMEAGGGGDAGPGPGADGGGAGPVPGPESAGGGEGMGGDPMGGMGGGDMGGGAGGAGGGAPPTPEAVDAICQELGWDKTELLNALLADPAGGGGGGMGAGAMGDPSMGAGGSADAGGLGGAGGAPPPPGGAGGASPPGMPPMPPGGGMEAQASAGRRKVPANIKKAEFAALRSQINSYLSEVRTRSQR